MYPLCAGMGQYDWDGVETPTVRMEVNEQIGQGCGQTNYHISSYHSLAATADDSTSK